jgi:UDP-hydrolysing UDP-N-acetyl-D-glucosamine 2-epimerase
MTKRRIVIVSGTRAEFGLLVPVAKAVMAHPGLELQMVATGVLALDEPLATARRGQGGYRLQKPIGREGVLISYVVPMQDDTVGRAADTAAVGRGIANLGTLFTTLQPDVVLVLGDRVEAFAAAAAGSIGGFRVGHIHGGDRAEGVADEAMRHAITKLAHLHFPATAQSRRRLIRMGESPANIWQHGSPAMDGLTNVHFLAVDDVKTYCKEACDPYGVVLQHPVGASDRQESQWMRATLSAVRACGLFPLVFAPNRDPGCDGIVSAIHAAGLQPIVDVPRQDFLSLLAGATVMVGNSSAGLIEASAIRSAVWARRGVPVVNVGPRQSGRERPGNVWDSDYGAAAVEAAIRRAMTTRRRWRNPYGGGDAGPRIAGTLAAVDLAAVSIHKRNSY